MGLEDEKKDLITREISKFRDTHKVVMLSCGQFYGIDINVRQWVTGKFLHLINLFCGYFHFV